jgi:hypothetical protein
MKTRVFGLIVLVLAASPVFAASLQISFRDGRVSIDAQDVTVRQILTEWARIGKTRVVNVERLTGGPITLKLENLPEKQALEIILRAVPGYMALPRETIVADASAYDRILVMPTTTAVAAARPQPAPGFPGVQPGANVTQLRPPPIPPAPLTPGMLPEPSDPADQDDDPAIAAAAAAGLVPVPAPPPIQSAISAPLVMPGGAQPPPAPAQPGSAASPSNPFGTTATSAPTFTPPPAPPATTTVPITRPRPPQPDR